MHRRRLGLGDFEHVDPSHAHSGAMDLQHDLRRRGRALAEDAFEDLHDELHRCVVVVVEQHLESRRPSDFERSFVATPRSRSFEGSRGAGGLPPSSGPAIRSMVSIVQSIAFPQASVQLRSKALHAAPEERLHSSAMSDDAPKLTIQLEDGVAGLPQAEWDALVGDESPFLEWAFLASLEEAGALRGVRLGRPPWSPAKTVDSSPRARSM